VNAPSRAPAGTPTGGQFAPSAHSETDVALSTFTPDELVADTKWKVVEHQSVGATTTATVTRGTYEKLDVTIDYDSGTVSVFDAHGEVDAPPIQETQWDDSEPFDGVGVARDTLAATPPPSQPLTPALAKRNARALDNLAVMFQDPEWGSGMLEDVAEQVGATGRPLEVYDEDGDWEMAEGDGRPPTGDPVPRSTTTRCSTRWRPGCANRSGVTDPRCWRVSPARSPRPGGTPRVTAKPVPGVGTE